MTAPPPIRSRGPARRRSNDGALPWSIKAGVPLVALVALGIWFWTDWQRRQTWLSLRGPDGAEIAQAQVELFEHDDRGSAPSPPPLLGEVPYEGGELRLGPELVPERAIARVSAPGLAIGYIVLDRGTAQTLDLTPAAALRGSVFAGGMPAAGAEIVATSLGPPYVPICSTTVDQEGGFVLRGHAKSCEHLRVRALQPGFEVAYADVGLRHADPISLDLKRTRPVTGRVTIPSSIPPQSLTLRVYNLAGVTAPIAADGSFRLDHLPPAPMQCRLLVGGLDEAWTHVRTMVTAGDDGVAITILPAATVSGHVVFRLDGAGAGDAAVFHPHGPHGDEIVRTDQRGAFTIGRLPPGPVDLRADHIAKLPRARRSDAEVEAAGARSAQEQDRPVMRVPPSTRHSEGVLPLDLQPGEQRTGLVIRIE